MKLNISTSILALLACIENVKGETPKVQVKKAKKNKSAKGIAKKCSDVYYKGIITETTLVPEPPAGSPQPVGTVTISKINILDQVAPVNSTVVNFDSLVVSGDPYKQVLTVVQENVDGSIITWAGSAVTTTHPNKLESNTILALTGGTGTFAGAYGEVESFCQFPIPGTIPDFEFTGCEYNGFICLSDEGMAAAGRL